MLWRKSQNPVVNEAFILVLFTIKSHNNECILSCFVEAHCVLTSYKVSQIGNKGINKKGEINVMEHLLFVSLRDCFFIDTFQMKVELFDCWFLV